MDNIVYRADVVTPANPLDLLPIDFVRDAHLRAPDVDGVEDEYIGRLIKSAYSTAEHDTRRHLLPTGLAYVATAFGYAAATMPCGPRGITSNRIVLPGPPLIAVTSVEYVDQDGQEVELDSGAYTVVAPKGPRAEHGYIVPNPMRSAWPQTSRDVPDAVTVSYTAGYEAPVGSPVGSPIPVLPDTGVPQDVVSGMLLLIAEMYKQRSESVAGIATTPAAIRAKDLFLRYRVY